MIQQELNNNSQVVQLEPFSPKKLIIALREHLQFVAKKWPIIIGTGLILGMAAGIYEYYTKDDMFLAEMSFLVDEDLASKKESGLSEISRELGLGATDAGSLFGNENNLNTLVKSRLLLEQTLRSQVPDTTKGYTFADFFLDVQKYRGKWMRDPEFLESKFATLPTGKEEARFQASVIGNIRSVLLSKHFKMEKQAGSSNIILVSVLSSNELFSKQFLEAHVSGVREYYRKVMTQKTTKNLETIQKRIDSVSNAYNKALYGRADIMDANINLARERAAVPERRKQTEIELLRTTYMDLSLKLENAKVSLLRSTPVIETLDEPILPLTVYPKSFGRKFFIFFIAGIFLAFLFLFLVSIYRKIMGIEDVVEPEISYEYPEYV